MAHPTLPPKPTVDQIDALAEHYAGHILRLIPPADRAPIAAYGRCLIQGTTPSNGAVLRFFAAMHDAGAHLPGYRGFIGRFSSRPSVLTRFETAIAVHIASHEAVNS